MEINLVGAKAINQNIIMLSKDYSNMSHPKSCLSFCYCYVYTKILKCTKSVGIKNEVFWAGPCSYTSSIRSWRS